MKEGTEGVGVHGVEGGLTLGLLPTGLIKHPAHCPIQGLLPSPSSSTSAPPSHLRLSRWCSWNQKEMESCMWGFWDKARGQEPPPTSSLLQT